MKIFCWNVNGIRASVKKGLLDIIRVNDADIYCFQETKANESQVREALKDLQGYHIEVNEATRPGYSGVAILSKIPFLAISKGIGSEEHDQEGRVLAVDFEAFTLINVYVPNSGNELARLPYRGVWDDAFCHFLKQRTSIKPLIAMGDFNVAHKEIDLARPKQNYNKTSGFTQQEIDGMDKLIENGFLDAYRTLNPDKIQYTFWSTRFGARANNVGWRIDYSLIDKSLLSKLKSANILDTVQGSDHCPILLELF